MCRKIIKMLQGSIFIKTIVTWMVQIEMQMDKSKSTFSNKKFYNNWSEKWSLNRGQIVFMISEHYETFFFDIAIKKTYNYNERAEAFYLPIKLK